MQLINYFKKFGVNRAVFWGGVAKLWFAVAGLLTLLVIAAKFSPELQGYYFTFYSLMSLKVIVELGLTFVIVYFSSHEWAKLGLDAAGNIIGEPTALSCLKSLARLAFIWFFLGAVFLALGLGIAGYVFFAQTDQTGVNWVWPWVALCLVTGANLSLLPAFSLLEGCNQVAQVYYYRFIEGVVYFIAQWIIMWLGGGLWAIIGAGFLSLVWSLIFLTGRFYNYFKSLLVAELTRSLDWRSEIWPMQWRIAISWVSGYFLFSFFVPVLFYFKGAIAAGQMGMTWNMARALLMIASMWIVARAPEFGVAIARKEYQKLDRLFFRSSMMAVIVAAAGSILMLGFIWLLNYARHPFAARFLPLWPTLFFLLGTILMIVSTAQATYLRAHKKEPFMFLSVASAVLMVILLWLAGSRWGALGIAISYFSIIALFKIPYGTLVWSRCRQNWHAADFQVEDFSEQIGLEEKI